VDLVQKVKYYLAHDDERREIARNGQKAVRERFSFDDRVKVMFKDFL
jgi:spore maturation protein CgeB